VDEVRESLLAAHLDHGDPRPVAPLQLGIAGDVDLLELEGNVLPHPPEHATRAVAEMAVPGRVEPDPLYGYRPRVTVASETRPTASAYAA
jgi:hypothetical protein